MARWSQAVDRVARLAPARLESGAMGKAIAIATPVFFLLIGLEWLVARWRGTQAVYRLNDASTA